MVKDTIDKDIYELSIKADEALKDVYRKIDEIALCNSNKTSVSICGQRDLTVTNPDRLLSFNE